MQIIMEIDAKGKLKIRGSKLFAFLKATEKLEAEIDVASTILSQIKGNGEQNLEKFLKSEMMTTNQEAN